VLSSTVPIVAIVNEVYTPNPALFTSYNAAAGGAAAVNLALVENAGSDGWSTGLNIMNTGGGSTAVTVTYFDAATGASLGQVSSTLAAHAAWGVYQGAAPPAGLPVGQRASVQVTVAAGSVAVICNEVGTGTFMSYGGR
jgi:hypothetical protein